MIIPGKLLAAACLTALAAAFAAAASAAPIAAPSLLRQANASLLEPVQWWGPWPYYGAYAYAPGYGYAPGSAYDAPGYSYAPGYAPPYGWNPGGAPPAPGYSAGYQAGATDVAYCTRHYRSYDPASRTYIGRDRQRHPCP
jgi:hypothetical protein